jgi:uncharacterized membrane protein YfcA
VHLASFAAAVGIGISLGLLGGGGSILTVPALVYLGGLAPFEATTSSLVVVGLTSVSGALQHARNGRVDVRAALLFAATGIPCSFAGSLLSRRIPEHLLLLLFALVMVVAGLAMLLRGELQQRERVSVARVIASGIGVGFLTGFLGVGGGFLIVPTLVLFAGVPMAHAVGTSLAVIAVNCAGGFAGRVLTPIDWVGTLEFSLVAIAGSFAGAFLVARMPAHRLRQAFAIFILCLAAFMLTRPVR